MKFYRYSSPWSLTTWKIEGRRGDFLVLGMGHYLAYTRILFGLAAFIGNKPPRFRYGRITGQTKDTISFEHVPAKDMDRNFVQVAPEIKAHNLDHYHDGFVF